MPLELIAGLGTALFSFMAKSNANALATQAKMTELLILKDTASSSLMDAAMKRSNPTARKVLAYLVATIAFCGLLLVSFLPEVPVSVFQEVPQSSILWGLIKWGKGVEVITASGFVLPPWFGWTVTQVMGFMFGTGAAKGRI